MLHGNSRLNTNLDQEPQLTQLQQAEKEIASLKKKNNRLKNELQAANEKHQKQLQETAKYNQMYRDATAQADDIQRKLDRTLAETTKIIRQLKRDSARCKRQAMLAVWQCTARNSPGTRAPDLDSVHSSSSDDDFGRDSPPTGLLGMTGCRPADSTPAPCGLQTENARLNTIIDNLKLRIENLEMRNCSQWYGRKYTYCS